MSTAITVILWMLVAMLGLGIILSVVVFAMFCFHARKVAKEIQNEIDTGFKILK